MWKKLLGTILIAVYVVGCGCVLWFGYLSLFGSTVRDMETMLNSHQRESAFITLSIGAIPMVTSCSMMHHFFKPKRKSVVAALYLPGITSGGCLLFIYLLLVLGPLFA